MISIRFSPKTLLRSVLLSLLSCSLVGCVVVPENGGYYRHHHAYRQYPSYGPPPPPHYYRPRSVYTERPVQYGHSPYGIRPMSALPFGASRVVIRGESCWFHNGSYYRRHPSGFAVFIP